MAEILKLRCEVNLPKLTESIDMSTLLSRFTFDPLKIDAKILAIVFVIWLVVLACGVGSVISHGPGFNRKQRLFWILLMVGVPVFGLLIYLPFSLKREGFTLMRQSKSDKKSSSSSASRAPK